MLQNGKYFSKHGDIVVSEKNGKQVAFVHGRYHAIKRMPWGYEIKIKTDFVVLQYTN